MEFNQLLSRLAELDTPATESVVAECPPAMGAMPQATQAPVSPPSMNVSLNAQGMDNIESLMKLLTKVNPDMMPKEPMPMPMLGTPQSIGMSLSKDNAIDVVGDTPDIDGMDDADEKKEWANSPDEEIGDIDDVLPAGDDLHKHKPTYPKVAGGDNPIQRTESTDLRAQIRAELQQRLAEAKGDK